MLPIAVRLMLRKRVSIHSTGACGFSCASSFCSRSSSRCCELRGLSAALAAVMAAAVADWQVVNSSDRKMKKDGSGRPPALEMTENPDILAWISRAEARPALVVGFAAETDDVVANATAKRLRKGCDWLIANDVSPGTGTFGGDDDEYKRGVSPEEQMAVLLDFFAYFAKLTASRRENPTDDLASAIANGTLSIRARVCAR